MYSEKYLLKRLKKYRYYTQESNVVSFTYEFNTTELKNLYQRQGLVQFGNKKTFESMVKVMHSVFDKLYINDLQKNTDIITNFASDYIFDMADTKKYRFSCWVYATTLKECFLSLGIPARMIRCLSGLFFDRDCHCVTIAYCEEYKKYVLFDVANNTVYYSSKGIPLSLQELRDCIIDDKRIIVLQSEVGEKQGLIDYWIKNMVLFQCYEKSRYGNELNISDNRIVFLAPANLRFYSKPFLANKNYQAILTRCDDEFWMLPH